MAKTLLLADDSVTIQKVVGISFAGEDVDLITVDNGDDAIAKAREARPDVILSDVVMPGKNGYEVCEAVKSDPALAHIPVLLLTGTFEAFDEERAARCGAAGHVAKPFEAQTLVARVAELLASPPPAPAPPVAAPAPPAPAPPVSFDPPSRAAVLGQTPIETRAVPNPPAAPSQPDVNDQSFDFFDDELAPPTPAAADIEAPPVDLDPDDSAFAFGDDALDAAPASGDRTVAMLPDEPVPAAADLTPPPGHDDLLPPPGAAGDTFDFENETSFGEADLLAPLSDDELAQETILDPKGASGFDVSSSDLRDSMSGQAVPPPAPAPSSADATEIVSPQPPAAPVPDPSTVGADLFADDLPPAPPAAIDAGRETVLAGMDAEPLDDASLDDMIPAALHAQAPPMAEPAPMPAPPQPAAAPEPVASPAPPQPPAATPPPMPEPVAMPEPPPMPEPVAMPEPPPMPEPVAMPEPPPMPEPVAMPEPPPMPEPVAMPEPPPAPEPLPEPMPMPEPEPLEAPVAPALDPAALAAEESEPMLPASGTPDSSALVGVALSQVEPRLREQLHDTLEKIAWESFGDVAEQIVRQALERVERVAWEVIPQMAETMIREELRKLKGEE